MDDRLFIAAELPVHIKEAALRHIDAIRSSADRRNIRWILPANWHITVKFLGPTDKLLADRLREELQNVTSRTRELSLGIEGPEVLGGRVISIKVADLGGAMSDLANEIDLVCSGLGFKRESRPFHPHITLARLREPDSSREFTARHKAQAIEPLEFAVSEISLFSSRLAPSGSVYTKLESFPLSGG